MIAADQLVGREVSFSKSGFQFPKGAYRVPMESPPSEFASEVTDVDLLENETRPRYGGNVCFTSSLRFIPFLRWPVDDSTSREKISIVQVLFLFLKFDKVSSYTTL